MFDLFGWLRKRASAAILAGVGDAIESLGGADEAPREVEAIEELRLNILALPDHGGREQPQSQTPAPEPKAKKRKGESA